MTDAGVIIDREFQALLPAILARKRQQLEQNPLCDGCASRWRPGATTGARCCSTAITRYEICKHRRIPFGIRSIALEWCEQTILWFEEDQLGRRNLSEDQRALVVDAVRERRSRMLMHSMGRTRKVTVSWEADKSLSDYTKPCLSPVFEGADRKLHPNQCLPLGHCSSWPRGRE